MTASLICLCGLAAAPGQAVIPSGIAPPDATMPVPSAVAPTPTIAPPGQPVLDPTKPTLLASRTAIIDIDFDPATRKAIQKVLLYVSRDQGQTWGLEATALPDQESFTFAAKDDGVYWCKIQTVFASGQKVPPDVTRSPPDQRLFLDGTPPVVRVAAKRVGDDVEAEWTVEEKYPDESNVLIRYKATDAADAPWVAVPYTPGEKKSVRFKPTTPGPIALEVIAKDLVGNASAGRSEVGSAVIAASGTTGSTPPVKPVSNEQIIVPGSMVSGSPPVTPQPITVPPLAAPPASPAPAPAAGPAPAAAAPFVPPPSEPVPVAVTSTDAVAPAAPAVKPINLTRFDLSYGVTAGPAGVSGIDLWVTRDDGKTWRKWSRHDGKDSVIKVVLDTRDNPQVEGPYGFRLVPESGARVADAAPTAGTAPEFRVVVDVTAPAVRVYEPAAHPDRPDVVVLRWKATDANFGREPIALEWAETQAGPWRAVNAADAVAVVGGIAPAAPRMANTGEFGWRLPADLGSPRVFLKFTAWDEAGNKTEAVTKDPMLVDLTRPRASIRGIVSPAAKP
jgi:hypothetical protein